jgi:LysM repeat protein
LLVPIILFWVLPFSVFAQGGSISPSAIIAAVNALRASRGLAAYTVDSSLMAYAQGHAEYLASTGRTTHQHSDGSTPWDRGLSENVASGSSGMMTAAFIVNTIWADAVHMSTMIGYTGGAIGVGVASNGTYDYISLDVRPTGRASSAGSSGGASSAAANPAAPAATVALVAPLVTATPRPDGAVYHTVGYGQSLWGIAIAYGVKINDIRALNGLAADSTTIYEGQRLLIFPAGSVTPPVEASPTAAQATDTPSPASTATRPSVTATDAEASYSATPAPTVTPVPSPTATPQPSPFEGLQRNGRTILIVLVFTAAGILFVIFLLSFRK